MVSGILWNNFSIEMVAAQNCPRDIADVTILRRHQYSSSKEDGGASRGRGHWRPGEDEALRQLVEQYGPRSLRWFTHLEPTLNRRPFSEEEEEGILNAGVRKEIKDLFPVLPQQMAAASSAFPASEITGTSMGKIPRDFLSLSI
ncbi:Transcription factor [Nymphaea thermarum]|nr:Transcription factor [Nymphaea thermarum]